MTAIKLRVEIRSAPDKVYEAIAEQRGLASWWTTMVEAEPKVGALAKFRFNGPDGSTMGPDMKVTELVPGTKPTDSRRVAWNCVQGPWEGHDFAFDIAPSEKGSVLLFSNEGWPEQDEFYMHCNAKWGFFLGVSLKDYLETGKGRPHPDDTDL